MSNDYPFISVCIPAYNAGKTIAETIDSILNQKYPKYEIIVCDNSSKDNTAEIVKSYSSQNVKYILNPIKGTAEENWNHILDFANGEFLALFHADDVYEEDMLSKQIECFKKNPDVGAVFTMSRLIDVNGNPIKSKYKMVERLPKETAKYSTYDFKLLFNCILSYGNIISTPTLMAKRNVICNVGKFNTYFNSAADMDYWLRIAKESKIAIINEPLHRYRISETQGTAVIYKELVELPSHFKVMDHYLSKENYEKSSFAFYKMRKKSEEILCAFNLLKKNQIDDAKRKLKDVNSIKLISLSLRREQKFKRFLVGNILLGAIKIGIGYKSARFINEIQRKYFR